MRKYILVLLVLFVVTGGTALFSQAVKGTVQAQLILKIITIDRNFSRFGDPIKIGVTSDTMLKAFKTHLGMKVKGKAFLPELINTLEDIGKYQIVYIDNNWKNNYKAACEVASKGRVLMFAASHKAVERSEAAIAFMTIKGKPKIVLNLGLVKEQGTDFPAHLLQLTMVVGAVND